MPTENRSSSTEMVSVPFHREDRYIVIKRSDLAKVPANYRSALVDPIYPLLAHLPSRECLVIESDWPEYEPAWAAIERRVTGAPAPQPHPEPIAWMVGTAIWWTKEEAERDAADTGLPVVAIGPVADPGQVERLKQELLVSRAQGRAEVVEMIAQLDAETGLDEFSGSHQIGCTGEWGSHWKEDTLRHHFDVDPGAASELERCRHSGYEIIILEEERDTLRAQLAERDTLLRECYTELLAIKSEIGFRGATLQLIGRIDHQLSAAGAEPEAKS